MNKFLEDEGCAIGSMVVVTENAYMTEATWEELSPSLVIGYRNLPIVEEIVDRFGAHLNNLKALTQRADAKIVLIKEEADSSLINQAYNKHTA
jgi:hypothetical protein